MHGVNVTSGGRSESTTSYYTISYYNEHMLLYDFCLNVFSFSCVDINSEFGDVDYYVLKH